MDQYSSYRELEQHENEGIDYLILARKGASRIAIIAPHGGGIEPGTAEIADAVAGDKHAFSAFKGIKKTGNSVLHITSERFDEPIVNRMAEQADIAVTIHGCRGKEEVVYVGGRHQDLKRKIIDALMKAGFHAEESVKPGLRGRNPQNICNRSLSRQGVQIEISNGLRRKMFENLPHRSKRKKTEIFYAFVRRLQEALD